METATLEKLPRVVAFGDAEPVVDPSVSKVAYGSYAKETKSELARDIVRFVRDLLLHRLEREHILVSERVEGVQWQL